MIIQSANRQKIEAWQPLTDRIIFAESFDKPAIGAAYCSPDGKILAIGGQKKSGCSVCKTLSAICDHSVYQKKNQKSDM